MKKDVFIRQSIEIPSRKIRKDHHKGPPEVINQHLGNQRTVTKKRMVPVEKSYKEGEGGGGGRGAKIKEFNHHLKQENVRLHSFLRTILKQLHYSDLNLNGVINTVSPHIGINHMLREDSNSNFGMV